MKKKAIGYLRLCHSTGVDFISPEGYSKQSGWLTERVFTPWETKATTPSLTTDTQANKVPSQPNKEEL